MGGLNHGTCDEGHDLEYGDFCEVTWNDFGVQKRSLCTFIETTDDGDRYFRFVSEDDGCRGDDFISDHYTEFHWVKFVCKRSDPMLEIAGGI